MPPIPRGTFALDVTHFLHSQALPWGSPHGHVRPRAWEVRRGPAVASRHGAASHPRLLNAALWVNSGELQELGLCQVPASLGTGFCRGPWWWMLDSSAGSDPHIEGRCSVLGRSEKCPQSGFFSPEQHCRPSAVQILLAAGAGATVHGSLALLCQRLDSKPWGLERRTPPILSSGRF